VSALPAARRAVPYRLATQSEQWKVVMEKHSGKPRMSERRLASHGIYARRSVPARCTVLALMDVIIPVDRFTRAGRCGFHGSGDVSYRSVVWVETIRIPRAEGCGRPDGANVRSDGCHSTYCDELGK